MCAALQINPPQRPLKILVVDDNRDSADSMAMLLRVGGHAPQVAYDGVNALEAARSDVPDVILLDLGLPRLDGYKVAYCLRADPATCNIRLIAITGHGQASDRASSKDAGFHLHLLKPVDVQELLDLLANGELCPRVTTFSTPIRNPLLSRM